MSYIFSHSPAGSKIQSPALLLALVFMLLLAASPVRAAQYEAGDLAPRGAPDGIVNVGDLVILQQMVLGNIQPTATEQIIGDVAPLNNVDGALNGADVLLLQRAVLGLVTLNPVTVLPPAPSLDPEVTPTNLNPYTITGTASANATINIYVNSTLQGTATASGAGSFSYNAILAIGINNVYAKEFDGVDESDPSNSLAIDFQLADGGPLTDEVGGTTLSANTFYTINNGTSITVTGGSTLVIEHGAELRFQQGASLIVSGLSVSHVQVNGMPGIPVVFTSAELVPAAGDWAGIEIQGPATATITNAVIEYATSGVFFNSASGTNTNTGGYIADSVIHNNINGIEVYEIASPTITGNQIYNNQKGLYVHSNANYRNTYPVVTGNEIYSNTTNYYTERMRNLNEDPMILDASGNWWGTADPVLIAASIHDRFDPDNLAVPLDTQAKRPFIDFSGYLDAPSGVGQGNIMPPEITVDIAYSGGIVSVVGDVNVKSGATLTINAGTEVRVMGDYAITVTGIFDLIDFSSIQVNGTQADPVLFTSGQSTPAAGDWKGIEITSKAPSTIDYAIVEYSQKGFYYNGNDATVSPPLTGGVINNCISRYNVNGITVTEMATPVFTGCQIHDNINGVYIDGALYSAGVVSVRRLSNPVITNSALYDNKLWNYTAINVYDVALNGAPFVMSAQNNWWGTDDPVQIASTINDYFDSGDSTQNPIIDYGHALDAQAGNPLALYVQETLVANTSFTGEVILQGDITVASGITLSVSSGAELKFFGNANLIIDGVLSSTGAAGSPILYTPVEHTTDRQYWKGISVQSTGTANIDYCYISGADFGLKFEIGTGTVSNCVITNNDVGVYVAGDTAPLFTTNSIVDNNIGILLYGYNTVIEPHPSFLNNNIYDNDTYNVRFEGVTIDQNGVVFSGNWWGTTDVAAINTTFSYFSSNYAQPYDVNNMLSNVAVSNIGPIASTNASIDYNFISPQASTGVQDTAAVTASFSSSANWTFEVLNSASTVIYSQPGSGTALNENWNGQDNGGTPQSDGQYRVQIKSGSQVVYVSTITIDNTLPVSDLDDALNGQTYDVVQIVLPGTTQDINLASYDIDVADTYTPIPADYRSLFTGNLNVPNYDLYTWVVNDSTNGVVEPSGEKTLRLTVTDKAGNTSTDTVTLYLSHVSITNVSFSPAVIVPTNSEQLAVSFTLGFPANVTLQIYEEGTTNIVANRVMNYTLPGNKTMLWDGKDDSDNYVSDEAYRFEIFADSGTTSSLYYVRNDVSALTPPGYTNFPIFDPRKNNYVQIALNTLVNVRLSLNVIQSMGTPINGGVGIVWEALAPGTYTALWDGRDIDGKMVEGFSTVRTFLDTLESHAVIVQGNNPVLTGINAAPNIEIKSDPHRVIHSYDQASVVKYTVDQDATVSVHLIKPCPHVDLTCSADFNAPGAITLVDNVPLTGGAANVHSFDWHGYDDSVATPDTNSILVMEEGTFTYIIKAVSVASGLATYYRGSLNLYQ